MPITAEERPSVIINTIWYWLPARWTNGVSWFEISGIDIVGDETSGGANVRVSKDGADPVVVNFTNDELYGEGQMNPEGSRARIEAV